MGTGHHVVGVLASIPGGLRLLAPAGSCEAEGVGKHGARPRCVSGDTGDWKMPVRVRPAGSVPVTTVTIRGTSEQA